MKYFVSICLVFIVSTSLYHIYVSKAKKLTQLIDGRINCDSGTFSISQRKNVIIHFDRVKNSSFMNFNSFRCDCNRVHRLPLNDWNWLKMKLKMFTFRKWRKMIWPFFGKIPFIWGRRVIWKAWMMMNILFQLFVRLSLSNCQYLDGIVNDHFKSSPEHKFHYEFNNEFVIKWNDPIIWR